jgi:hypothetical protein
MARSRSARLDSLSQRRAEFIELRELANLANHPPQKLSPRKRRSWLKCLGLSWSERMGLGPPTSWFTARRSASFLVRCKLLDLNKLVGANGFEPSTSWSRTSGLENLKSCRCRAYDPNSLQNLPSVGPRGTHHAASLAFGLTIISQQFR